MVADTKDVNYSILLDSCQPCESIPLFCQFFSFVRREHGLSIKQLSRVTGMTERQIVRVEAGQFWGNITRTHMGCMESALGLRAGSLIKGLRSSVLVTPKKRRRRAF